MNYFNKTPYPANFQFADSGDATHWTIGPERLSLRCSHNGEGVFRLQSPLRFKESSASQAELTFAATAEPPTGFDLKLQPGGMLSLTDDQGRVLIESSHQRSFGVCGSAYLFCFRHHESFRFYGMGEKLLGLELSGVRTRFWNTDAFADFDYAAIQAGRVDPYYVSIPYLIVRTPHGWVGLLLNNPYPVFMSTAADIAIESFASVDVGGKTILLGAEDGDLDLFIIAAPTLAALTRSFQSLVGTTPLPPLWALGYQQCRWGYRSVDDLRALKSQFAQHDIPADGLWLDIDYMDGYRVFTFDQDAFPDPAANLAEIRSDGQKVVPIIDPGVKREDAYSVFQDGLKHDVYCRNPEGKPFVGLVWPGETVFPDFSREDVREWWANQVKAFAEVGVDGAWLDMNDPAVGSVNLQDMLFDQGQKSHASYHNQYATGMARASREGFLRAHPDRRPFLVTRSNFLAGGRYAAVWTGDNVSNYTYLRKSFPTTLNLALSGIPFNGGDVGGFGDNTTAPLLRTWMRAGFLMPFFRNHSATGTTRQEPWAFDELTLEVCREFIRSRYKLLPYLYQLFATHEATGEAIMRPLFYDFDSTPELDLDRIEDAYLLGPSLLHAPIVYEHDTARDIPLPGPDPWYSFLDAAWMRGGQWHRNVPIPEATTALYVRNRSILPMRPGVPTNHHTPLNEIELHVFLNEAGETARLVYVADDGASFGYQRGERTRVEISAASTGHALEISTHATATGYGPLRVRFVAHGDFTHATLNGTEHPLAPFTARMAGCDLPAQASEWLTL